MGEIPGGTDKKLSDNHTQIPTGITQNVKDLLASREIENIFENSDFVYLLNQASGDRQILSKALNISPSQQNYITNSNAGEGLIFYGSTIVPFKDDFPKDTMLYRYMTTRLSDMSDKRVVIRAYSFVSRGKRLTKGTRALPYRMRPQPASALVT